MQEEEMSTALCLSLGFRVKFNFLKIFLMLVLELNKQIFFTYDVSGYNAQKSA
jgi:hypothetical protein